MAAATGRWNAGWRAVVLGSAVLAWLGGAHGGHAQDVRASALAGVHGDISRSSIPISELRALFDRMVERTEARFVYSQRLKDLDWRRRTEAAWRDIAAATSLKASVDRMNLLLDELKTSHTRLYTRDDVEFYILADVLGVQGAVPEIWSGPPMLPGIGTFTATFDGRDHITHVLEGSPADKAGLRVGDEIVSVDGGPYGAVTSFRGRAGRASVLEVRKTRDGERLRVEVPVVLMRPTAAFDQAARNSARVIERGGKRIGYVHLWQMRDADLLGSILGTLDAAWREPRRGRGSGRSSNGASRDDRGDDAASGVLDAIIIDNRAKIGGSGDVGTTYLTALAGGRGGRVVGRGLGEGEAQPLKRSFAGRSAMLIDGGTRSAAELFAFGYGQEKLGPIIGERTAGAVTGASAQLLPGGVLLYLGVSDVTIDGQRLEGKGVEPTVPDRAAHSVFEWC